MPTRLPARSAKPMGRNTACSLWFEQVSERCLSAKFIGQITKGRDVTPLLEAAHFAERHRALVGVADALERFVLGAEPDERTQLRLTLRITEWFAREYGAQVRAREKWRQHQVDEEALVAFAAPLRRAFP